VKAAVRLSVPRHELSAAVLWRVALQATKSGAWVAQADDSTLDLRLIETRGLWSTDDVAATEHLTCVLRRPARVTPDGTVSLQAFVATSRAHRLQLGGACPLDTLLRLTEGPVTCSIAGIPLKVAVSSSETRLLTEAAQSRWVGAGFGVPVGCPMVRAHSSVVECGYDVHESLWVPIGCLIGADGLFEVPSRCSPEEARATLRPLFACCEGKLGPPSIKQVEWSTARPGCFPGELFAGPAAGWKTANGTAIKVQPWAVPAVGQREEGVGDAGAGAPQQRRQRTQQSRPSEALRAFLAQKAAEAPQAPRSTLTLGPAAPGRGDVVCAGGESAATRKPLSLSFKKYNLGIQVGVAAAPKKPATAKKPAAHSTPAGGSRGKPAAPAPGGALEAAPTKKLALKRPPVDAREAASAVAEALSDPSGARMAKLTVPQLKAFLKSKSLPIGGRKAELVERARWAE